jgi:hypothetical protein
MSTFRYVALCQCVKLQRARTFSPLSAGQAGFFFDKICGPRPKIPARSVALLDAMTARNPREIGSCVFRAFRGANVNSVGREKTGTPPGRHLQTQVSLETSRRKNISGNPSEVAMLRYASQMVDVQVDM